MNTIPASEIKRRGISIVDPLLINGPVQVIKNNRVLYVIQNVEQFAQLSEARPETSLSQLLHNRPWAGSKSRDELDQEIAEQSDSWE